MRVLLTVDAVGGVWQYGLDLSRALAAQGVEPIVALLGPAPSADQRRDMAAAAGVRFVETGLPLDWLSDGPGPVLAAGARIAELAQDERADLLQLNTPTLAAAAPPPMPVIAVAHGCVSTWWQAANPGRPLDPSFRWHQTLTGEGLRAADLVVAPTLSYARTVARCYGLGHTPAVVHNGRTAPAVEARPVEDVAFTAGRLWDRVKRTDLLDRVAARLAVPFLAAGPLTGPHGETVEVTHLQSLGRLDTAALDARLAARPVFVSAACFEPFGLAVLEAAASGCALVLAETPGFRELWEGAATFVRADDEADYARAIEALIADPAERQRLGEAAQLRARRFTPAAMATGMLTLYRRALDARLPSGRAAA
jgi:glycosyltransferase involved in cell wall biosynthesis